MHMRESDHRVRLQKHTYSCHIPSSLILHTIYNRKYRTEYFIVYDGVEQSL